MKSFWVKVLFMLLCVSTKLSATLIQQTIEIHTSEKIIIRIEESVQYEQTEVSIKLKSKKDPVQVSAKGEIIKIEEDVRNQSLQVNLGERSLFTFQNVEKVEIIIPRIREHNAVQLILKRSSIVDLFDPYSTRRFRIDFYDTSRFVVFDYDQWKSLSRYASEGARSRIQLHPTALKKLPPNMSDEAYNAIVWSGGFEKLREETYRAPAEIMPFTYF